MTCPTCGREIAENEQFCTLCGTAVASFTPAAPVRSAPVPSAKAASVPKSPAPQPKLLGPWAYFGLQLLFSVPIVGFIFLIIFSFDNSNLNRRNFARSYWCVLLVVVIIAVISYILFAVTGGVEALYDRIALP